MIFFAPVVVKYEENKRASVDKTKPCYTMNMLMFASPLAFISYIKFSLYIPQSIKS